MYLFIHYQSSPTWQFLCFHTQASVHTYLRLPLFQSPASGRCLCTAEKQRLINGIIFQ